MCSPIVQDRSAVGNPGIPCGEIESRERRPTPIPGWTGKASRSALRRDERKAAAGIAAREAITARTRAVELGIGILDCSLFNLTDRDRRTTSRQQSLNLTDAERDRLRRMAVQAEGCGSRWGMFRSFSTEAGVDYETRLACQMACGTRACERCAKTIREREAERLSGPWQLFFTFTLPRQRADKGNAWRWVHGWVERLVRELRRESRIASISDEENEALRKPFSEARREAARRRVRCSSEVRYAWVLEPHKDGYPHVHMVVDAAWIEYAWLRGLWERTIGVSSAWVYGEKVYQVDGVCRYLTKYISKARLSLDILAIMYRRRLWATNLERKERPEPRWFTEESVTSAQAQAAAENGDYAFYGEGWEVVLQKKNAYTMWRRPAQAGAGYEWFSTRKTEEIENGCWENRRRIDVYLTPNKDKKNAIYASDIERIEALAGGYGSLTGDGGDS